MLDSDGKADLHRYLQDAREALLWKLDGLSEYDVRRPLVPTGTNLLGLVKHVTAVELGYFGDIFGRPSADPVPWDESDEMSDMFAFPEESRESLIALYRRTWAHSDATIDALPLDAIGHVPWWPAERSEVTLHHMLVRVATETARHAGHADIVRELIDGTAGWTPAQSNLPDADQPWWQAHHDRVERAAQQAGATPDE
ncbi:MAG: DinB family protein [Streptosporangiaceae bacterium]